MKKLIALVVLFIAGCSMTLGPEDTALTSRSIQPTALPPTPVIVTQQEVVPVETKTVDPAFVALAALGMVLFAGLAGGAMYFAHHRQPNTREVVYLPEAQYYQQISRSFNNELRRLEQDVAARFERDEQKALPAENLRRKR